MALFGGSLKKYLKQIMARVRAEREEMMLPVEGSGINPPPPLMPQTSMPQREMYAVGGWAARLARQLIKKHNKDPKIKSAVQKIKSDIDDIDAEISGMGDSAKKEAQDRMAPLQGDETPNIDPYPNDIHGQDVREIMELSRDKQELSQALREIEIYGTAPEFDETGFPIIRERDVPFSTGGRVGKQEGGNVDAQMTDMMEEPTHTMPDGTVMPGATHEEYIESTQLPDEEMEEDYVEFIMSEALEPEEQQYLTDRLVEDDQLSMIFDKVVETASEFSGSGSVDGPGTGISDSIPARLSDGEFVMTAKATDAIGADTLQELMSLAEQEAETGRQAKAIGGEAQRKIETASSTIIEDDPIKLKNKEAMRSLDPRLSLFAS